MQVLEEKPEDPIPKIMKVLDKMAQEEAYVFKQEQIQERNEPLNDEELRLYSKLVYEKQKLLKQVADLSNGSL